MKIVCISDTHEQHRNIEIPDGDILIHAGDFTFQGDWRWYADVDNWLFSLPHEHKIIVAGNHDFDFYKFPWRCITLENDEVVIEGLRIWGSPYTPTFGNWAFMEDRGKRIREIWKKIPDGLDVLITHGPMYGIGDLTPRHQNVGCDDLTAKVWSLKNPPRLHVFGHIHHGYGKVQDGRTLHVNASICNEDYSPDNEPIVVDL